MIENFQGASTARLCSAMFENATLTRSRHKGNTQGVVEKQNFNHATQNGVQTPSLLSQKHQLEKHFITVLFYERIAHLTKKFTRDFDTKGFCSCI